MSVRWANVEVRCDARDCPHTTWVGVSGWKGQLDRDELERGLADDRWTVDEGDSHYCPRCAPRNQGSGVRRQESGDRSQESGVRAEGRSSLTPDS